MAKLLSSPEINLVGSETLLMIVKVPPGARGRHAALAFQRPRLVRLQLRIEGGVDASN